jgi:hypothetical protein
VPFVSYCWDRDVALWTFVRLKTSMTGMTDADPIVAAY